MSVSVFDWCQLVGSAPAGQQVNNLVLQFMSNRLSVWRGGTTPTETDPEQKCEMYLNLFFYATSYYQR